jgi:ribonuclease HII
MARTPRVDLGLVPDVPGLVWEMKLWQSVGSRLAGIDEAGRGALAGPVAAAAVILPADPEIAATLHGVRDSKQMTPRQRATWAERIYASALAWGVGMASSTEIDTLGIGPAARLAAERAVRGLQFPPDYLLFDAGLAIAGPLPQTALVKGDRRSLTIAAASILAKTSRDTFLNQLDSEYPAYGFAAHKGYGTPFHLRALAQFGPTPHHRCTFAPLRGSIYIDKEQSS